MVGTGKLLNRAGRSYLELLVVVTVISVLALTAIPMAFGLVDKWKLESAAWRLVSDMRLARQTAISTGIRTRIEFRFEVNDYRIFFPEETKRVKLPDGVSYFAINYPLSAGVHKVEFTALGAPAPAGTVTLVDRKGRKLYVISFPATGRIRVSPEPPPHW